MWTDKARKLGVQKSRESSAVRLKIRTKEYRQNPSLCASCNSELEYKKRKNKFCSHSCSVSFNNRGLSRNTVQGIYKKKKCLNCENFTYQIKFCSRECYKEYAKVERRNKIEASGSLLRYQSDKWYLIETRDHKCEVCGTSEWQGKPIPLDIDHKNGNSDNDNLDNVRLICPNCHRQTETHGSKNKNGRHSKRKDYRNRRYAEEKSY